MTTITLIVGASGGLGRAFCLALKKERGQVIAAGRNLAELDELVSSGLADHFFQFDLADEGAVDQLARKVVEVDLLVVAAGMAWAGDFADQDWGHARDDIAINAVSVAHLVHVFGRRMLAAGRGRIILIGSTAAVRPAPGMAAYAASKAFLHALAESLAVEWEARGVQITCCITGPMATGFAMRAGLGSPRRARDPHRIAAVALAARTRDVAGLLFSDFGAWFRFHLFAFAPRRVLTRLLPFATRRSS